MCQDSTDQAVEEEVVVVSHGGIVEDRGHLRALGVLDQQFSGLSVRIDGVWKTAVSIYFSIVYCNRMPSLVPKTMQPAESGLTLCQQVELVHEESLILGPGEVESLGRHELRNTILLVIGVMLQLRDAVQGAGLEAQGGGRFLGADNAISLLRRRARVGGFGLGKQARHTWNDAARRAPGLASRLNMMGVGCDLAVWIEAPRNRRISLPTHFPIGRSHADIIQPISTS